MSMKLERLDQRIGEPGRTALFHSRALETLYAEQPIDPGRAARYLAAALPRGPEYPKIFHCAALVYFALGDRDTVVAMVAQGRANGGRLALIRDDMRLAAMWGHPDYAELFGGLDPPEFRSESAAVLAGPGRVIRLRADGVRPETLRTMVNLRRVTIGSADPGTLHALATLPQLTEAAVDVPAGRPAPIDAIDALVGTPTLDRLVFAGTTVGSTQLRELRSADGPTRRLHLALLFDPTGPAVAGANVRDLVVALDSALPAVRAAALDRLGPLLPAVPLRPGDRILLTGRLTTDRGALLTRLSAAGVTTGDPPTLAVVGVLHRGKALTALEAGVPLILEDGLRARLDTLSPAPLAGGDASADRLRELLGSPDPGNVALAVTLARKGGLPAGLTEELIAVAGAPELDRATRAGLRRLVAEHFPPELRAALALPVARSLYVRNANGPGHPISMVADAAPGTFDRVRLLAVFAARLPPDRWTRGRRFDTNNRIRVDRLPGYVLDIPDLTELNLPRSGLLELPADIGRADHLVEIRVPGCPITELPAGLRTLDRLRVLDVSWTRITVLPDWLAELGLRQLNLHHCPLADTSANRNVIGRLQAGGTDVTE